MTCLDSSYELITLITRGSGLSGSSQAQSGGVYSSTDSLLHRCLAEAEHEIIPTIQVLVAVVV